MHITLTMKTEWKTIDSAPKDGTVVLLFARSQHGHASHTQVGFYSGAPRLGKYPNWRWGLTIEPTHWMPLPEPPK